MFQKSMRVGTLNNFPSNFHNVNNVISPSMDEIMHTKALYNMVLACIDSIGNGQKSKCIMNIETQRAA